MASQLDLDQGGTFREWSSIYLGPSVGWVRVPVRSQLVIAIAGTYVLDLSTNYVQIAAAVLVTIVLPSLARPAPAGVLPGKFVLAPVTIVDVVGTADVNPVTIQPAAGNTIMGLAQVQITSKFGGFILYPNGTEWSNQS